MCEQCSAQTKTYGEVVPGWWLVQATKEGNMMKPDDFGLVACNDPDFIWPLALAPQKDPAFDMTEEEFDNMTEDVGKAWDDFQDYTEKLSEHFSCDPIVGYSLMQGVYQAGYSRKEYGYNYMGWLSHRMAVVIERNPTADEKISEMFALQEWGEPSGEQDKPGENVFATRE
jgi:hypothetical protein